MAIKHIITK